MWTQIAMLLALLAQPAAASDSRSLAKKLSHAAAHAGIRRLAVLPLASLDGSDEAEGRRIAEALATDIALRGELIVVERSMLGQVMGEHALGRTGALEKESLSRLGALQQAEAVAAGTFVTLGNIVEVNIRVVVVETGVVVTARSARLKRDWFPALRGGILEPSPITADMAVADVYEEQTGRTYRPPRVAPRTATLAMARDVRDAAGDECSSAAERVDSMQEGILELKARYWAAQARRPGFSAKGLQDKPGALMSSPELRQRFYEMLRDAVQDERPLSLSEVRRFVAVDREAFELYRRCGLPLTLAKG